MKFKWNIDRLTVLRRRMIAVSALAWTRSGTVLPAFPQRRPFFDEGLGSFFGVFGLHHHALEIRFIAQPLLERHLAALIDGFLYIAQRQRSAFEERLRHFLAGGK